MDFKKTLSAALPIFIGVTAGFLAATQIEKMIASKG
jgi:hypothetical protein